MISKKINMDYQSNNLFRKKVKNQLGRELKAGPY